MERYNKMWMVRFDKEADVVWEEGERELVGPGKLYEMEEILSPYIETPFLQLEDTTIRGGGVEWG